MIDSPQIADANIRVCGRATSDEIWNCDPCENPNQKHRDHNLDKRETLMMILAMPHSIYLRLRFSDSCDSTFGCIDVGQLWTVCQSSSTPAIGKTTESLARKNADGWRWLNLA